MNVLSPVVVSLSKNPLCTAVPSIQPKIQIKKYMECKEKESFFMIQIVLNQEWSNKGNPKYRKSNFIFCEIVSDRTKDIEKGFY